jgi:hypothetical protein
MNRTTVSQVNWFNILQVALASFVLLVGGLFASFSEYKADPYWVDASVFPVVWTFLNLSHILLLIATLIEDDFGLSIFGSAKSSQSSYTWLIDTFSNRWFVGAFSILSVVFLGIILGLNLSNYAYLQIGLLILILLAYLVVGGSLFCNLDIWNNSDSGADGRFVVRNLLFISATFNLLYTVFLGAFETNHKTFPEAIKIGIIVIMIVIVFITIMLGWEYKFVTNDWRWIGFGLWLAGSLGIFGATIYKLYKAHTCVNVVSAFAFFVVLGLIIAAVVFAATKKEMPMWVLHSGLLVWLSAGALPLQIKSVISHSVSKTAAPKKT